MTRLTRRQAGILADLASGIPRTASQLHVRSDALWRMEERGLIARNSHEQWYIRSAGSDALDAYQTGRS